MTINFKSNLYVPPVNIFLIFVHCVTDYMHLLWNAQTVGTCDKTAKTTHFWPDVLLFSLKYLWNSYYYYPVCQFHDDVIKQKHFPRYWPFVRRIPLTSHHKFAHSMMTASNENIFRVTGPLCGDFPSQSQCRGAFSFSLIFSWTNGCENNRVAGDLKRRRTHYGVLVMQTKDGMARDFTNIESNRNMFKSG